MKNLSANIANVIACIPTIKNKNLRKISVKNNTRISHFEGSIR